MYLASRMKDGFRGYNATMLLVMAYVVHTLGA